MAWATGHGAGTTEHDAIKDGRLENALNVHAPLSASTRVCRRMQAGNSAHGRGWGWQQSSSCMTHRSRRMALNERGRKKERVERSFQLAVVVMALGNKERIFP